MSESPPDPRSGGNAVADAPTVVHDLHEPIPGGAKKMTGWPLSGHT